MVVRPFSTGPHQVLAAYSEIRNYRPQRGCMVKITFSAALPSSPLTPTDARVWLMAFHALLDETHKVIADLKEQAQQAEPAKKRPAKRSTKRSK